MALRVTLIQGGGAGLDQVPAVTEVLKAAGVTIEWDEYFAGWASVERGGQPIPKEMLDSIRKNGLGLKTSLMPHPDDPATHLPFVAGNYNIQLRRELGLFASVRPVKNIPGLLSRFQGVDILIIRELTEDLYASIEHEIVPGVVQSIKVVTEAASKRFFRFALEWARSAGRKTVTCVHKANILKLADGLFLEAFREVSRSFPEITSKEIIIDNCCMQMVSKPQQFDVLVMGNLFGDLVSDLGSGLVGGTSATHAISIGEGIRVYDTFQGSTSSHALFNHSNPLPLMLPAIDLLESVGERSAAQRIASAVSRVLTERSILTDDLGGKATTQEMTQALIAALPS